MKNKFLLLTISLLLSICGIAQTPPPLEATTDSTTFTFAEKMPIFQGSLNEYLKNNIKYPYKEKEKEIQGTVYFSFVVEKDGSVSNVRVIKEVPCAPGFSLEGIRVISNMPVWIPGTVNGRPVRVEQKLPIKFMLEGYNSIAICGKELTKEEKLATCNCNPGTLPEFPGGDDSLQRYITKNISLPDKVRKEWAQTRIYFSFIIDTTGEVCDVHVMVPGGENENLKNEIARVLCEMPLWKPGRGDKINMRVKLEGDIRIEPGLDQPIVFKPMELIPFHEAYTFDDRAGHNSPQPTIKPSYTGGAHALEMYLNQSLVYPEAEKKAGKEGIVVISFIVEMDGSLTYIDVKSEVENAPGLTIEAKRLVAAMPKWSPGKVNGVLSRMPAEVSVSFEL
jgi:hypothetical protein